MQFEMTSSASKFSNAAIVGSTSMVIKTFAGPVNIEYQPARPGRPSREDAKAENEVLEMLASIVAQADIDVLSRTMSKIDDLVLSGNFGGLNRVLRRADITQLEPIAALTLLRTTYPMRELLKDWRACRDRTHRSIKKRALAADKLMHGLFDN